MTKETTIDTVFLSGHNLKLVVQHNILRANPEEWFVVSVVNKASGVVLYCEEGDTFKEAIKNIESCVKDEIKFRKNLISEFKKVKISNN